MTKFILGTKSHMSQVYSEDGLIIPVTVVSAEPCVVTQIKQTEKEGYVAVQVGRKEVQEHRVAKPQRGHTKAVNKVLAEMKEFRVEDASSYSVGDTVTVSQFVAGDIVKVSGTSKGKGFQGVVKRHGFKGAKTSHGTKDQVRMPGSIGATGPQRVFKGTRMGGRMGGQGTTVTNLEIIKVDEQTNQLYIKGAVPGANNGTIEIYA